MRLFTYSSLIIPLEDLKQFRFGRMELEHGCFL
jgi:hypothetical protein